MTPELEIRWKSGEIPFNGNIVTSCTDSSMETLLEVMRIFIETVVDPSDKLFIYEDWHEHDGFITSGKPISFSDLKAILTESESLKSSTQGDDEVRTSIYPDNYSWLMRWCIDLEDNAYCDFEFCCSKDMSQKGLELMYAINPDELNRNTAKVYFDRSYGG